MKIICFFCKNQIKTPQPATWTIYLSIICTYQPNGSAFYLCVVNVWKRSFNVRTNTSSTMLIIATQRCNVKVGGTNNSKVLVSNVQESQEKASVLCRGKIFTIRRLCRWFRYMFWRWRVPVFFMLGRRTHYFSKTGLWPKHRLFRWFWRTFCSNQSVPQALVGDEGSGCPPGHMHCNSSTECVAMDKVLCNFSVECKD